MSFHEERKFCRKSSFRKTKTSSAVFSKHKPHRESHGPDETEEVASAEGTKFTDGCLEKIQE